MIEANAVGRALGQAGHGENRDAMVLVVVCQEGDHVVRVGDIGLEHRPVPVDHRLELVGAQDRVREPGRRDTTVFCSIGFMPGVHIGELLVFPDKIDFQTGAVKRDGEIAARSQEVKMNQAERREFVRAHRTAIFGYNRKHDGPSMSIVYYVSEGDDLLVSTMAGRGKAKAVRRNPRVSLCVLDEKWPPTYLQVYCDASIETDLDAAADLMMRIAGVMAGQAMPESVRPTIRQGAITEKRVVLRLRPYQTFETPPRHVYSAKDVEGLTHGLGQPLPWK